jgi:hypothetical protein
MGHVERNLERVATQPRVRYAGTPWGPITVQRHADHTTAVGPAGAAHVALTTWRGLTEEARRRLLEGVAVAVDDRPVAVLRQRVHGARRGRRTIDIEPLVGDLVPVGARFRRRGLVGATALETDTGPLIRHPFPTPLTDGRRLDVADGVPPEVVLVFAAVALGLTEALRA